MPTAFIRSLLRKFAALATRDLASHVRYWLEGANDTDRYEPTGTTALTQELLNRSVRTASDAVLSAAAWLRGMQEAAAPPEDDDPDRLTKVQAREQAASSHPVLRGWARCSFGPSLPAPSLGEQAVIALEPRSAGSWGSAIANMHWALREFVIGDMRAGMSRLIVLQWALDHRAVPE
ncbi:hypothetical protein [Nonomuraea sp. NPDC049400]|uniref:hypothetical protein n=1 Tax=Nonomuraea sp. NPDC049400 TaxID=3364352 RepID=UPI0037BCBAD8